MCYWHPVQIPFTVRKLRNWKSQRVTQRNAHHMISFRLVPTSQKIFSVSQLTRPRLSYKVSLLSLSFRFPFFFSLHTYLVTVAELKKTAHQYESPALHSAEAIVLKYPSGSLVAKFLVATTPSVEWIELDQCLFFSLMPSPCARGRRRGLPVGRSLQDWSFSGSNQYSGDRLVGFHRGVTGRQLACVERCSVRQKLRVDLHDDRHWRAWAGRRCLLSHDVLYHPRVAVANR